MVRWAWLGILLTMAAPGVRAGEVAEGYELIRITEDADFDDRPRMNNCGQVVWSKRIGNVDSQEEIFLWENGVTTRITNDSVRDAFPDINDHGVIVWSRAVDPGGHFAIARLEPGGEIEILTDTPYSDWTPTINNSGQIAWDTCLDANCRVSEVFRFDENGAAQISFEDLSSQGTQINHFGQIVWTAYDFRTAPWSSEIMLFDGTVVRQLNSNTGQHGHARMNDSPQVVWVGARDELVLWENGFDREIAESGSVPHINRFGNIAFGRSVGLFDREIWLITGGSAKMVTFLQGFQFVRGIAADGTIAVGVGVPYDVDNYLLRKLRIPGDVDGDDDVDLLDISHVQNAMQEDGRCRPEDMHRDGTIGLDDFRIVQDQMSGPR